ncbi:CocE/NonD family hydrolase C-terminal non-catalytic domain-containing protein [Amycolatopsis mediterranei]|uniref:X-Pro dipeptidyl-peptidase n=1 Tax=Amycolatopsis mediterranei (strain U-32) TaxID=749927 RepID=A0A0H3DEN0_AMYMU|nr:CocE/NonD family hydrolase C-terminal non-catalytic domain-containing protein [Amycolatopsis mediterranei]ADJ48089.1 X-Pro dipeptidyl-peptidase [Amycolatopsis mediterranei U32]KDO10574.1 X-Pro dipeptidyl-peptidase [Amycolatopsis mediterranei]KDU87036.1 X-Pro dipeptidyl-peptidase [Amycolatopsis mediterranei]UZF73093.1 X-Pro dipeptidyl-peptidase [Amycolatopsis mediterranei]
MRLVLGFLAALLTTAGLAPVTSAAPLESRPVYSYADAIRETAWVETGTDHDHDGKLDRVAADVIRPDAPVRVPAILDVSPYYACCGRGNEQQKKTYAPDGTPAQFPLFYDNYFVPRGYAVVLADVGGTNRSSGCFEPIEGVADNYAQVIANGAPLATPENTSSAFTYNERAAELCKPFEADLKTRAGTNGDYNAYWQSVNHVPRAGQVSALVAQGFGDWIVAPNQFARYWDALGRAGVPRKAWLSQAGHTDPFDLQRAQWVETLHRWFDRWLLGLHNGVEREPAVHLETAPDRWTDVRSWPPATSPVTFRPSADGTLGRRGSGTVSVADDPAVTREEWTARFTAAPLPAPVRIAGSPAVTITASSDKTAARLGVALVDYGPAEARNTATYGSGVENLATRSCWGAGTDADSAYFLDTAADVVSVDHRIVAAGWADLGHHASLWHGEPLVPGRAYSMTFTLTALDHVVPAGHRLGLVLGGTDGLLFDPALPRLGDTVTFDLARTSVTVGFTKPEQ